MRIALAGDHAGFDLKNELGGFLRKNGHEVTDLGAHTYDAEDDYPDFAARVARAVSEGTVERGILICGTGIGMSIVANKFEGVRAALCHNLETAQMSRLHNDSNVLALGSRVLEPEVALNIVREWLQTDFDGGRHQRRLDKIKGLENKD